MSDDTKKPESKKTLATLLVSQCLPEIASVAKDALDYYLKESKEPTPPLCLIVFTPGEVQYITNLPQEEALEQLRRLTVDLESRIKNPPVPPTSIHLN